jgi:hypothetical protein
VSVKVNNTVTTKFERIALPSQLLPFHYLSH